MSLSLSRFLSVQQPNFMTVFKTNTHKFQRLYFRGKLYEGENIENKKMITVIEMMKVGNISEKAATILQFCI